MLRFQVLLCQEQWRAVNEPGGSLAALADQWPIHRRVVQVCGLIAIPIVAHFQLPPSIQSSHVILLHADSPATIRCGTRRLRRRWLIGM